MYLFNCTPYIAQLSSTKLLMELQLAPCTFPSLSTYIANCPLAPQISLTGRTNMALTVPNKKERRSKEHKHIPNAEKALHTTRQIRPSKANQSKQSDLAPSTGNQIGGQQTSVASQNPSLKVTSFSSRIRPLSGAFDDFERRTSANPSNISSTQRPTPSSMMVASNSAQNCQHPSPEAAKSDGTMLTPNQEEPSIVPTKDEKKSEETNTSHKHSKLDLQVFHSLQPRRNLGNMPAEIQQMIWGHVIMTPACHTFKIIKNQDDRPPDFRKWWIELWPRGGKIQDTSAYRVWKHYLHLNNSGFQSAFDRTIKALKPISLRVKPPTGKRPQMPEPYKEIAAIDEEHDLVIFEFERGPKSYFIFTWFEHLGNMGHPDQRSLKVAKARRTLAPFRKIAILWGNKHCRCGTRINARVIPAPFFCYCPYYHPNPHHAYKACPSELSCFLDLFSNLEQFYFVVEPKGLVQDRWSSAYRGIYVPRTLENFTDILTQTRSLSQDSWQRGQSPELNQPTLSRARHRLSPGSSMPSMSISSKPNAPTWRSGR